MLTTKSSARLADLDAVRSDSLLMQTELGG